MKLQKLISRLQQKHHRKLDLSLGRTFNLLNKLGNPQDRLNNVISIVGTNSKYSICQSLKAILNQSGYKCNLYLSPHLQSYTERFIFNDKEFFLDFLKISFLGLKMVFVRSIKLTRMRKKIHSVVAADYH